MKTINSEELRAIQKREPSFQLIDVREAVEYQSEHLPGARNVPLSVFEKSMDVVDLSQPVYVLCRTGSRAVQAVRLLQKNGCENVYQIEGGLEALKSGGFDTIKGPSRVWAMDRQVRMGAGVMILIGVLGSWFIHSGFLFLSAFVACGLIFSAFTNTCGMALLLAKCPWNQIRK